MPMHSPIPEKNLGTRSHRNWLQTSSSVALPTVRQRKAVRQFRSNERTLRPLRFQIRTGTRLFPRLDLYQLRMDICVAHCGVYCFSCCAPISKQLRRTAAGRLVCVLSDVLPSVRSSILADVRLLLGPHRPSWRHTSSKRSAEWE